MDFNIEWFDKLNSTNTCLHDRFCHDPKLPSGSIIAAREQTAGRGRMKRKWLSSPDTNLCFSLFIETAAELIAVPSLTMAATLAVTEQLNSMRIPATAKWPNDVLVGGGKICGILSERVESTAFNRSGIIIGIGLNVNMPTAEAAAIDRPATSILIESGQAHPLNKILDQLLPLLDYWIVEWEKGGFSALRHGWTEKAGPIGKPLTVHDGDIKKRGTLAGFGDHGELLLQTIDGLETIWSGDIYS